MEKKTNNVRNTGRSKLWALFFQNFFEGLGSAFLYTIAISIFNENSQVYEFTYMLIGAGLITIAIGPLYERIEHRARTDYLLYGIGLFIILLLVVSIYFTFVTDWRYAGVALLVIHNLVYFFSNIQFWGMSALIFDVRESKRIFSIVGSGDLPAKFLGYSMVVPLTSNADIPLFEILTVGAIGAYILSLVFLRRNIRFEKDVLTKRHHDHRGESKVVQVSRLFENKLIRSIAGMAAFAAFIFFLLEFAFLKDIMHDLEHSDKGIAKQLAIVMGVTYGVATVLKLFVSSRYLQKLNLRLLLYSFPAVIVFTGVVALLIDPYIFKAKPLYLAFIILFIVGFIIRDAFYKPLSLSLYQPLPREKRLHGHNVVKGLAEPAGMVAVGVVFLLIYGQGHYKHLDFKIIAYVLTGAMIPWILTSERMVTVYRRALTNLINRKLFSKDRFLLIDKPMESALIKKLKSDNPMDILYALRMLRASNANLTAYLDELMYHRNPEIRLVARNLFMDSEYIPMEKKLAFIRSNIQAEDRELRLFCLLRLGRHGTWEEIRELLEQSDQEEVYVLLKGWAWNKNKQQETIIRAIILEMVHSENRARAIRGLHLMKHYPSDEFSDVLLEFMQSDNRVVVRQAIDSTSSMLNSKILDRLYELLVRPEYTSDVQEVLRKSDLTVLRSIRESVTDSRSRVNFKLISVIGNHHDKASKNLLIDLLRLTNPDLREFVLGFTQLKSVQVEDMAEIRDLLGREIRVLESVNGAADGELARILQLEQSGGLHRLFKICALIARAEAVNRAEVAYFSGNKDLKANAIETMSIVLPSFIFSMVRPYLEVYPNAIPIDEGQLREEMLRHHGRYYDWSIASIVHDHPGIIPDKVVEQLRERESKLINEQLELRNSHSMADSLNLHLLEKVMLLKQTPLFAETPENILLDVAEISEDVEFSASDTIFNKGEDGDCLYIIYSGKCEVTDDGHLLAVLEEKDFFGDLALLDPQPRSATVKAKTKVALLKIGQHAIYELMSDRVEVARGIIKVLCRRLRNQNLKFTEVKSRLEQEDDED